MAFTDIRETTKNSLSVSRDDKQRLSVSVSRTFDLLSDAPTTDETIAATIALQNQGQTTTGEKVFTGSHHPLNYWYICESISVERVTPIVYTAKAEYKSPKFRDDESTEPTLQAADVKYSTVTSEEAIDEDVNGDPIATATGELYQGVTKAVSDLQVTIGKNFSIFNPVTFYEFYNCVNSDTFLGFPAGTAKVMSIDASPVIESDFEYWKVTVQIQFRKPGPNTSTARAWWVRLKHEGYYCFTSAMTDKPGVRCVDINRDPATSPQPLDDTGRQINSNNPASEVWREFEIYETVAFSGMNLGV